ncbi:universal stress protein [Corallincola platygyrae]|uniref:Universal stress protein n=1 Tax=Corallincola platygyrae TaxID=1193278 RepID=A0ABW4XMU6_9GAMM
MAYQHILVAVDLAEDAARVALHGAELARTFGAKLSLVMVEPGVGDASLEEIELGLDLSTRTLPKRQHELALFAANNIDYPLSAHYVLNGELGRQVQKAVEKSGADLLIAGKHMDHRWLAAHAGETLAKHVSCDLLLVTLDA